MVMTTIRINYAQLWFLETKVIMWNATVRLSAIRIALRTLFQRLFSPRFGTLKIT